ncbi:Bll7214 protein [Janthinobacterium sp. CG23_2]|nr:Bll7214 protein [Janthinobacterium sp. CG23_2]CUU31467.1 Bll7214 protein [Janthinobacterium sp. CG23_2]
MRGYPDKLKIYRIEASPFWQVRCFESGKTIKLSTKTTDKQEAVEFAKSTYNRILVSQAAGKALTKGTRFDICSNKMLEAQKSRVARGEFSKMSHDNDTYMLNKRILPVFRDMELADISFANLQDFVSKIGPDLAPSSIQRHLGIVHKVMEYALHRQLLLAIPNFPTIKKKDEPRGWFPDVQYQALIARATDLVGTSAKVQTTEAGPPRTLKFTADLPKMIQFMVNSFVRPTDLKNMQHKHVEIMRSDQVYLRLSLPKSKDKDAPIVTMEEAVTVYEQLKSHYAAADLAGSEDYVFMPQYPNRDTALRELQHQFNYLLGDLDFKTGPQGEARTIYSLRHTSIMFRLLDGDKIDLLTLARNARTSVEMIERFYASKLTGEQNIDMIQSDRRNPKVKTHVPTLTLKAPNINEPGITLVNGNLQLPKTPKKPKQ